MFETLDSIPWTSLQHAYGRAGDTPSHLVALASPSAWKREAAMEALSFSIYHQGSVYEASAYAVPFLAELLECEKVQDKQNILELLFCLATGGSWHESHYHLMPLMKDRRDTPEYQKQMQTEKQWVQRLKHVLDEHVPSYLKMLKASESTCRLHAIQLITALPFRRVFAEQLKSLLENDQDEVVRASACLYYKSGDENQDIELFAQIFNREESPIVKIASAIQLIHNKRENAVDAINYLAETVPGWNPSHDVFRIPDVDLLSSAATALTLCGHECAVRHLPYFIAKFRAQGSEIRYQSLLFMALCSDGSHQIPDAITQLSELQKQAVMVVADAAWYPPRTIMGNNLDVLRQFKLPDRPELMDQLLGLPNEKHKGFAALFPPYKKPWWKFF